MTATLTVRVPADLRQRLKVYATKAGETVQDLVTRLIEAELKGKRA